MTRTKKGHNDNLDAHLRSPRESLDENEKKRIELAATSGEERRKGAKLATTSSLKSKTSAPERPFLKNPRR